VAWGRGWPATGIKVDRSLTAAAARNDRHARLVRGIVRLAEHLGITCTAEGIESQEQAAAVAELGFERGQGYFFGKPSSPLEYATA
jgi:EAL domain-containing protein (putative c-di-GMP-specific phosphodiesterase class I)